METESSAVGNNQTEDKLRNKWNGTPAPFHLLPTWLSLLQLWHYRCCFKSEVRESGVTLSRSGFLRGSLSGSIIKWLSSKVTIAWIGWIESSYHASSG